MIILFWQIGTYFSYLSFIIQENPDYYILVDGLHLKLASVVYFAIFRFCASGLLVIFYD